MNSVKTLVLSFVLLLASFSASIGHSQTLYSARQKLEQMNTEMGRLDAKNQEIGIELKELDRQIVSLKNSLGNDPELIAVEEMLNAAKQALEKEPTKLNKDRLEMAEFKQALIARKQAKSTPELALLLEHSEKLQDQVNANELAIGKVEAQLPDQLQLIERLEAEAKAAERIAAQRKREAEANAVTKLKQAESEKQKALEEIDRLRQQLAAQDNPASAAEPAPTPKLATANVIDNTPTAELEAIKFFQDVSALEQFLASTPPDTSNKSETQSFAKFLIAKNLQTSDTKTKPIKLKPEANGVYINDKVNLVREKFKLIVGLDSWSLDLAKLDPATRPPQGSYSIYLVTRNTGNQILIAPN